MEELRETLAQEPNDVKAHHALGRELARRGRPDEALEHYLWVWDHALEHQPSYSGVRGSFLLSELEQLAATHPPAREALGARRDACERRLVEGGGDRQVCGDLAALNRSLGEPARTLAVYDRLRTEPPAAVEAAAVEQQRRALFEEVLDQLLEARRYADVVEGADWRLWARTRIEAWEEIRNHPEADERVIGYFKGIVVPQSSRFYEALVGVGRDAEAAELAAELLAFEPAYATWKQLVKSAHRADSADTVARLLEQAGAVLTEKELKRLRRAAR